MPVDPSSDPNGTSPDDVTIPAGPRAAEAIPHRIGPYKVLGLLGEGGFGVVYEAKQTDPRRRVAIKVIKPGMDSKAVVARFEAERQALGVMNHPFVSRVFDGGMTGPELGSRPYFAMELVRGDPITEFCDNGRLKIEDRVRLLIKVCEAVQHAHAKGVVHRDLKPSNILVSHGDKGPEPKVIDFGVAKALTQRLTESTVYTAMGQMIGTPAYMSPEQAEMTAVDIDTRSDVYSLGVILYELLTGNRPFDSEELRAAGIGGARKIIREREPSRPSTRLSTLISNDAALAGRLAAARDSEIRMIEKRLRGELDWVVMKCLAKERDRRYESVHGLAVELQRFLDGEVVLARPPSRVYRARKFVNRNRFGVWAASVVVLALAGATGVSVDFALKAQRQTDRAERKLARANEVKRLITEMLEGVDPEQAQGEDTTLLKGLLGDTANRLNAGEVTDELIAAELHGVIGNVYRTLGNFPEAEQHLTEAVKIYTRDLGADDLGALSNMALLGIVYVEQARYGEAETLFAQALEGNTKLLGPDDPVTLSAMHELGMAYSLQGRHDEAEPLLLAALESQKRVLGEEDGGTLVTMTNLAGVFQEQGRIDEAEGLYLQTLEIQRRVLGEQRPNTLHTMNNLANVYMSQNRLAESEALYLRTIESRRHVLGEEHPDTLMSIGNLAQLYNLLGRYDEAEPLLMRAVEGKRRVRGPEHPDTLGSMLAMAVQYSLQGKLSRAVPAYLELIEIQKRVFGEAHAETLSTLNLLALVYGMQDRYDKAESVRVEILDSARSLLGPEHPDTLGAAQKLGVLYEVLGRFDDVALIFEESLPIMRRTLGARHELTLETLAGLTAAYEELGRHADALPLYAERLEQRALAAEDQDADAETLNAAAWSLLNHEIESLRDPNRALALAERACARERADQGPWLWMYLETLAMAHSRAGAPAAAVDAQRRAIDLMPDDADPEMLDRLDEYEAAMAREAAQQEEAQGPTSPGG